MHTDLHVHVADLAQVGFQTGHLPFRFCNRLHHTCSLVVSQVHVQCSSQRQWQRAVLSQRSKHSCGFNCILSTTSKENYILKSGGSTTL